MLPLLILTGQAGSGKDTVAQMVAQQTGGVIIAQSDPMKRLVRETFQFNEDALWGPSESRNFKWEQFGYQTYTKPTFLRLCKMASQYVHDVLPGLSPTEHTQAVEALEQWGDSVLTYAENAGGVSARYVLQTLGTEWGRTFSRDMWSKYAIRTAVEALGGGRRYSREGGLTLDEGTNYSFAIITDGRFRNEIINVLSVGGKAWRIDSPNASGADAEKAGVAGHKSETEQRSIPDSLFSAVINNRKEHGLECLELTVKAALVAESRSPAKWDTFYAYTYNVPRSR